MTLDQRELLLALRGLSRVFEKRGFEKKAAMVLAADTLRGLRKQAAPGWLDRLGPIGKPGLIGAGVGAAGGGLYEYFRPRESWERAPSVGGVLQSMLLGGGLGGAAGGLYGLQDLPSNVPPTTTPPPITPPPGPGVGPTVGKILDTGVETGAKGVQTVVDEWGPKWVADLWRRGREEILPTVDPRGQGVLGTVREGVLGAGDALRGALGFGPLGKGLEGDPETGKPIPHANMDPAAYNPGAQPRRAYRAEQRELEESLPSDWGLLGLSLGDFTNAPYWAPQVRADAPHIDSIPASLGRHMGGQPVGVALENIERIMGEERSTRGVNEFGQIVDPRAGVNQLGKIVDPRLTQEYLNKIPWDQHSPGARALWEQLTGTAKGGQRRGGP